jgi:Mrp family chromosome partitioning ATPase
VPFLRAIRAHPLLVAAVAIVAVGVTAVYHKTRTPTYEASAQVLLTPVASNGPYVGLPVVTEAAADPARTLQTATSVLESPAAERATASQLGKPWTRRSVHEAVSVQPRGESNIVSITGSASSASEAAALANAYTHDALSIRGAQLSSEAKAEVSQLQEREKALPAGETANAAQISAQISALSSVAGGHDPNFSLLQAAIPPTSRSGSSLKLLAVLALLAGLVIGTGAATAIEYLNRRVRDEDEVLSLYPLPVLSRVPPLPRGAVEAGSFERIPPRIRESFRTLQYQISSGSAGGGRAIMFTSPSPRDGKTSSAINFAFTLAAARLRVILFDFDLRKPDVGQRLGVRSDYLELFRSHADLDELLVDVRSAPGLRVISSSAQGDVTPLLEAIGRRLPDLLQAARGLADYVIVDTPPIGQVSDALRAAVAVDDIVLVVRPGNTNREELQHSRELLDRMGHTPTGLLVIGESGAGDVYAAYGSEGVEAGRLNGSEGGSGAPPLPERGVGARSPGSLERPKPGS